MPRRIAKGTKIYKNNGQVNHIKLAVSFSPTLFAELRELAIARNTSVNAVIHRYVLIGMSKEKKDV
jgi:hypothetical protein